MSLFSSMIAILSDGITLATDMDNDYVSEMVVYDVGGARTQRHQWMNYFEDSKL